MAPRKTRNQPLDILRGIAILMVLGYHDDYFRLWGRAGWSGVDLFFVLSGFLISGLLFSEYKRTRRVDTVRFLVRRGFKIYPAFYALMAVTAAHWLIFRGRIPTKKFLASVFFLQDYLPHIWGHGWSLAVEEHFYWMLPLLLLWMIARSRNKENPFRAIPWTFAGLAIVCLGFRINAVLRGDPLSAIQLPTHMRIDSLFAGVTLGYYRHIHPDLFARLARKAWWLLGVVLLVPAFVFPLESPVMETIGFTLLYTGYGSLLVWSVDRKPSRNVVARALAWTGRYSYSIYLWHLPLRVSVFKGSPSFISLCLFVAASILFGAAMSRLIEIPLLKLRERLFPPKTTQPPDVVVPEELTPACEAVAMR